MGDKLNNDTRYFFELISGSPVKLGDTCSVYPLTLKEIGVLGYIEYQNKIALLTASKNTLIQGGGNKLDDVDVYDIIAATSIQQEDFRKMIEDSLSTLIKEPVKFFPDGAVFVIGTMDEIRDKSNKLRYIDKKTYSEIAQVIRLQNVIKVEEKKEKQYASEKARQLAEKRERGRKAMAQAKGQKETTTIEDLVSMAGVFTGNISKVMEWTVYQLHNQCEAFIRKEDYESKFNQLLAGADPKKVKLDKHWSES